MSVLKIRGKNGEFHTVLTIRGDDGYTPVKGVDYSDGVDGKSAYGVAVEQGFVGTEAEWLTSLHGADGKDGKDGQNGADGKDGKDGQNGADGKDGVDGEKGDPGESGVYIGTDEPTEANVWIDPSGEPTSMVNDVQINGESIVADGVADIPMAKGTGSIGLCSVDGNGVGGVYVANGDKGLIRLNKATWPDISERSNNFKPIVPTNIDYAVKAAMCDGKGAAWTSEEQAMARARMDADGGAMEFIADITTTEDADVISIDKFPDGTPLKLKSFDLYFIIPKASINDYVNSGYKFKYNNETKTDNRDSANKLISSKFDSYNNMYVIWNNARPIGFVPTMATWPNGSQSISTMIKYNNESNFTADYICEVHLAKYTSGIQIPSGTRMVLWGVRA